jgi:four helix bundle protein
MSPRPYESLYVWRLAHQLAIDVDIACEALPFNERFELSSQLRRAARSVPANLVEGNGAGGPRIYSRHVQVALGSVCELDYHLLFARDRGYLAAELCEALRDRAWAVRGLLLRLARSLVTRAKAN